jgi:hypothetical protein
MSGAGEACPFSPFRGSKQGFWLAHPLHWPKTSIAKRRKGEQIMANGGEFDITITAQSGGGYTFVGIPISTPPNAVTLVTDPNGGFQLKAYQGVYAFVFIATNFQFSADAAMSWKDPSINRNLTWASKDNKTFVMTNINFVTNQQAVAFTINPDPGTTIDALIPAEFLQPIDPTVLNNPLPGGGDMVVPPAATAVQEMVMAG